MTLINVFLTISDNSMNQTKSKTLSVSDLHFSQTIPDWQNINISAMLKKLTQLN